MQLERHELKDYPEGGGRHVEVLRQKEIVRSSRLGDGLQKE